MGIRFDFCAHQYRIHRLYNLEKEVLVLGMKV
jgi:hypothetical protein